MNTKKNKVLIERDFPERSQVALQDFNESIKIIQNLKNLEKTPSLKRVYNEFVRDSSKYAFLISFLSILNVFLYRFYLGPGLKKTYSWLKSLFQFLQKRSTFLQKLPLMSPKNILLKGAADDIAKQTTKVLAATDGNASIFYRAGNFVEKFTNNSFISGTRAFLFIKTVAGLVYYFSTKKDAKEGSGTTAGSRTADGVQMSGEDINITDEVAAITFRFAEVFVILDGLFYETKLKPYVVAATRDPNAIGSILIGGSVVGAGFLNIVVNYFLTATLLKRRVVSFQQARKFFRTKLKETLDQGTKNSISSIRDAMSKSMDQAFEAMAKDNEVSRVLKEAGFIPGSVTGNRKVFDLKEKIKEALSKCLDSNTEPGAIYQDLIAQTQKHIDEAYANSSEAKEVVSEVANQIIKNSFLGANKGIDDALGSIARDAERNNRRARNLLREVHTRSKTEIMFPTPKGSSKDPIDWNTLKNYRKQKYEQIIRELLDDFSELDDDFLTYYHLSGAGLREGTGIKIPGGRGLEIGKTTPGGLQARPDKFSMASVKLQSNTTHAIAELRAAQETLLTKYNKKIRDLNEEIYEAQKRNKQVADDAAADIVTSSRPLSKIPDEILKFDDFKNMEEFEKFIDDVYSEISMDSLRAHSGLNKEIGTSAGEKFLADVDQVVKTSSNKQGVEELKDIQNAINDINFDKTFNDLSIDDSLEIVVNASTRDEKRKAVIKKIIEDARARKPDQQRLDFLQRGSDKFVESSAVAKFSIVVGLFSSAWVGSSLWGFYSKTNWDQEDPLQSTESAGDFLVSGLDNDYALYLALQIFTFDSSTEKYLKPGDRNFKKVVKNNIVNYARQTKLFNGKRGNQQRATPLSKAIWNLKTEKGEDSEFEPDDLQALKKFAATDITNIINSDLFTAGAAKKQIESGISKKREKQENIDQKEMAILIQTSLIILAFSKPIGTEQTSKIYDYMSDSNTIQPKYKNTELGAIWTVRCDNRFRQTTFENFSKFYKQSQQKIIKKEKERANESIINGDINYLSNLVRETILEYRQLDNYNKYPYYSEIGSEDEEQKDFIEDWKDFELSLVRDESRETAIELAKILVKDLELFGDVVDLVGKNQSVGVEILKKIKNTQKKS